MADFINDPTNGPITDPANEPPLLLPESTDRVLCFGVVARMQAARYTRARLLMQDMKDKYGEIRILVYYKNFDGWEENATKIDLSMALEYGDCMTKIAFVNPPPIIMAQMKMKGDLHAKSDVRYYNEDQYQDAVAWANAD